jgi:inosine-uridine nucleoside N-ribohydrolase
MEPRIKEKIERIVLMGGAFGLLRPEYNIRRDYLAASIVFGSGVPITAVGLDVTLRCKLEGADLERLRAAGNEASRFLVRLIELWQNRQPEQYPTLHDPLAMAVAFRAGLVETQLGRVEVETAGAIGNGLTLFTPSDRLPKDVTASTRIARQVDVRGFLDLLVGRLAAPPRGR